MQLDVGFESLQPLSYCVFVLSLVLRVGELALPQFLSLAAMHATPAMLPPRQES